MQKFSESIAIVDGTYFAEKEGPTLAQLLIYSINLLQNKFQP